MSGINLSLPVDVPWELLATTESMMDTSIEDAAFPPKWRSSIAIFGFEPEISPDEQGSRKVTYFKVVCTVTGYQSDRVKRRFFDFGPIPTDLVQDMEEKLNRYFACYAALLQVAIYPASEADRSDIRKYPIITDVEPKRRDLYELVTDTGESLSASSNRAAVSKGFTSTLNTESTVGLSVTGEAGNKTAGASVTGSLSDKSSFGTQDQTITAVDYAREKRESESHVTSLTQMYNLLQAYHVGTNRVVFLVLPRPHVSEQVEKRTFIDGPREIEGIQEFFFIAARPNDVEALCVKATLETGHLDLTPESAEALTKDAVTFAFDFKAPRNISHGESVSNDSTSQTLVLTKSYTPPAGWEVDMDRGSGGYVVLSSDGAAAFSVSANAGGLTITASVVSTYTDVAWSTDDFYTYQDVVGELSVFIKKKAATTQGDVKTTFFSTARTVIGCTGGAPHPATAQPDWVVFEAPVRVDPRLSVSTVSASMRMQLSNQLIGRLGTLMLESMHSRPRYKAATVAFHQSRFVLDRIVAAVRRRRAAVGTRPEDGGVPPLRRGVEAANVDNAVVGHLTRALGSEPVVEDLVATPGALVGEGESDSTPESELSLKWKALGFGPRDLLER
jgi:hypothetical protein